MERMRSDIIAIDPDRERSGVASLIGGTLAYGSAPFPELVSMLESLASPDVTVYVEAGWLVPKSNYHPFQGLRAEKIARDVGANHETGRKIIEMCRHLHVRAEEVRPLKKQWKGRGGKITHVELNRLLEARGFRPAARTCQDTRDAILILLSRI